MERAGQYTAQYLYVLTNLARSPSRDFSMVMPTQ